MSIQEIDLKPVQNSLWNILAQAVFSTTGSAYTGAFRNSYVGLIVQAGYPGFSLTLQQSQIGEPTYSGYARQAVTWGTQGIDPTGRPQVYAGALTFQPTGSAAASTIIGAFLSDALTAGHLLAVGILPTPVGLGVPTDQLDLTLRLAMPIDPANWGAGSAVN